MQCRELREIVDSYLAEELLVETNHEVLHHLEGCPDCRTELTARRQLRRQLRMSFANAPELAPPPELAAEISSRLRRVAGGPSAARAPWLSRWLTLAAGVFLVVAIGFVASKAGRHPAPTSASTTPVDVAALVRYAVGDHRDCALHFRLDESPISLDEAARLYGAADHSVLAAVRLTSGAMPGGPIEIVEGHSCVFEKRRFAHLVLRYRGRLVSVVIADDAGASGSAGPVVTGLNETGGFQTAFFTAPRHLVFVVSDLGRADNIAVARAISDSLYRHFAGA